MKEHDLVPQEELDKLTKLEEEASPKPWRARRLLVDNKHTIMEVGPPQPCGDAGCPIEHRDKIFYDEHISEADGDLIAGLRNAAPALLTEVSRSRQQIAKQTRTVTDLTEVAEDLALKMALNWSDHCTQLKEKDAEIERLRKAAEAAREELVKGYQEWDSDKDHHVGKRISNACETLAGVLKEQKEGS